MALINEEVIAAIHVISSNNPRGVLRELRKEGYVTQFDLIPIEDIEAELYRVYMTDKTKFYNILSRVDWNNEILNWTNQPANKDRILAAIGAPASTARLSFGSAWQGFVTFLAGQEVPGDPGSVTEGTPASVYIALAVVALAVVGIVIFALRKTNK